MAYIIKYFKTIVFCLLDFFLIPRIDINAQGKTPKETKYGKFQLKVDVRMQWPMDHMCCKMGTGPRFDLNPSSDRLTARSPDRRPVTLSSPAGDCDTGGHSHRSMAW